MIDGQDLSASRGKVGGEVRADQLGRSIAHGVRSVSQILRLTLQAPDPIEAILDWWGDQRVMLNRLERPLPAGWAKQRSVWFDAIPARSVDERNSDS